MKELTVIIPFLNERHEVENTLNSLIDHTDEPINIIVINDASDDGYNYDTLKEKYNITYIKNRERIGVAECRNFGIKSMETEYFLLLDAHMRFYTKDWYKTLLKALRNNPKSILCCQSRTIWNVCGELIEYENRESNGAYININADTINFLDAKWDSTKPLNNTELQEIPCILGAGYSGNKKYWTYLRGLEGLYEYGLDEQFLSLKVWLTGGKCFLVKNIILGHIYRNSAPYKMNSLCFFYNKMLITETLLPNSVKYRFYNVLKSIDMNLFNNALKKLNKKRTWIEEQKKYFKSITTKEYNCIEKLNKIIMDKNAIYINEASQFSNIENKIIKILTIHQNKNISISHGLCGKIIILLLWAKVTKSEFFEKLAESFISIVNENLSYKTPIFFENGLLGVGWCWEFLIQNKLLEDNSETVFEDIDKQIMSIRCDKIKDYSLETGLQGIILYILARIKGCIINNREIPFDKEYMQTLYNVTKEIILTSNYIFKDITPEIEFIELIEKNYEPTYINPLNIKDINNLVKITNETDIYFYHLILDIMKYTNA